MRSLGTAMLTMLAVCVACGKAESGDDSMVRLAAEIVRSSGIKAGLCIHLPCADGALTTELAGQGRFVVHGLALDAQSLANARRTIQGRELYGPVSIDCCAPAKLPYAEDIVNLLVVDDLNAALKAGLRLEEVMRVLCPNGVAYVGGKGGSPDADGLKSILGKAGIKDYRIIESAGVWARIQKPRPKEMDGWTHWRHGPDGNPVSRDAAAGIPARLKWLAGPTWARMHAYFKDGSCNKAGDIRAMVSDEGRLFYAHDVAPRGMEGPMRMVLTARDAFSGVLLWGKTIETAFPLMQPTKSKWSPHKYYWFRRRSLAATDGKVYAVLKQDGPLLAIDGASGEVSQMYDKVGSPEEVVSCNGRLLIVEARKEDAGYGYGPVCCLDAAAGKLLWRNDKAVARYLAVDEGRVFCETASETICLDLADGSEKWRKAKPEGAKVFCLPKDGRLFLKGDRENLYAVSSKDGGFLWRYPYKDLSGYSDTDIFFADGLIWVQCGGEKWAMVGINPETGAEAKRIAFPEDYPKTRGHHRCHPNKATERYFLLDTAGVDFVDRQSGRVYDVRAFRGNCYVGYIPANGLLYLPPNVCQCQEWFRGFTALAPAGNAEPDKAKDAAAERIEKGPAYAQVPGKAGAAQDEWPAYRHDAGRSGSSPSEVPTDIKLLWERKVAGKITGPTVAEGMAFVASSDAHQVCAFDAMTGEPRWSYTAGGRIDTPPTIYSGLALFGCRDGWVYCLRAKDGELVWRFRASPQDRRIVAFDQVESSWPVFGSVLIQNDTAFVAAGRFSELDGGILVYALDPRNGAILWSERTGVCLPGILEGKVSKGYLPVSINDVLLGDGESIFMGKTALEAKTGKASAAKCPLWARSGMTDGDSWTGRMRWRAQGTEAELFVLEGGSAYGLLTSASGKTAIIPGKGEYRLFAKGAHEWSQPVPLRVNSMVATAKTLFVAGTPDVVPEKEYCWTSYESSFPKDKMPDPVDEKDFWAAVDGRKGGELWAVSTADGGKQSSIKLDSAPAYDALAAAKGRLYLSTADGKLLCFGRK